LKKDNSKESINENSPDKKKLFEKIIELLKEPVRIDRNEHRLARYH
jgi:hypothetical protein